MRPYMFSSIMRSLLCVRWPMIAMWHNARKGTLSKSSPMCKHIAYRLDLVYGQSLCILCDPIYEAFLCSFLM
jgi:type IV secretory pathway protease TraF